MSLRANVIFPNKNWIKKDFLYPHMNIFFQNPSKNLYEKFRIRLRPEMVGKKDKERERERERDGKYAILRGKHTRV